MGEGLGFVRTRNANISIRAADGKRERTRLDTTTSAIGNILARVTGGGRHSMTHCDEFRRLPALGRELESDSATAPA